MSINNTIHIIGVKINNRIITAGDPEVQVCMYAVCEYAEDYYE